MGGDTALIKSMKKWGENTAGRSFGEVTLDYDGEVRDVYCGPECWDTAVEAKEGGLRVTYPPLRIVTE